MPNWDDPRGRRRDDERDRWRGEDPRARRDWQGGERRSFGEDAGRFGGRGGEWRGMEPRDPWEPWRRDRYGARFDQERSGYGGGRTEDAGEAAWRRRQREDTARFGGTSPMHDGEPYAYGGQEYGLEGHPGVASGPSRGGARGFDEERRRNFDFDDPGVGQSQAGYGSQARSPHEHDFDPDYLRWRDEQLRGHDRDYQDWRREQHRQYDDQYRQFRSERQRHFGQAFHEWRSQRSAVGGAPDTSIGSVGQGQGGYGDKTGIPGGYNAGGAAETPSGMLDPPGHLSSDPAMSQTGGPGGPGSTAQAMAGSAPDSSPEFGKTSPQVQAASQGEVQRRDPDEKPARDDDKTKRH